MTRQFTLRRFITIFDLPLLVFLASAMAGVWIAYDKPAAWSKLTLIASGLAFYSLLARCPETIRWGKHELPILKWLFSILPALVALYFFLTNDWAARAGKVPGLDPFMRWFATWQPSVAALRVNSNVIGGMLAMLLPLQIASLLGDPARHRTWLGIILLGLSGLGLLMSVSRGAWLAFAFVMAAWITRPDKPGKHIGSRVWAAAVVIALIAVIAFLALTPMGESLLKLRSDRLEVWRNSLDLASDYPFTGLGLGNFELAYSSYALLVHVGHTIHAHNLFLDIWLEHGLLGLLALVGSIVTALWPSQSASRWKSAAIASLCVMLLHGLVDDALYGYGGRAAFLLPVPFAMLARSESGATRPSSLDTSKPARRFIVGNAPYLIVWGIALVALVIVSLTPSVQAIFKANMGAVLQTQVELTGYRWPESKFQDAVRWSAPARLAPAIEWYQFALKSNPANVTANRRLGQIELSLQQSDAACRHLQAAYAAAPDQRATRQLLGECYAIAGDIEQAAQLWQTIDTGQGQLMVRQWWYGDYLGEWEYATRISQAALLTTGSKQR